MTKSAHEAFSAFLDGAATELDMQRLLKALEEQPELMEDFHALSKTQALLQGETLSDAARVIRPQAMPVAAGTRVARGTLGVRLMQGGIAAAVAAVMIISTLNWEVAKDPAPPLVATVTVSEPADARLAQQQAAAQQRLEQYLKEHAEQASFTTGRAIIVDPQPVPAEEAVPVAAPQASGATP